MKNTIHYIAILVLMAMATTPQVRAQSSNDSAFGDRDTEIDISLENSYHPPRIYVLSAKIDEQTADTINGTLKIINSGDHIVGDLQYVYELYAPLPTTEDQGDNSERRELYDRGLHKETFTLVPGESKEIPFEYVLPKIPAGEYNLHVQMLTSKGRALGWGVMDFTTEATTSDFIHLYPGTIELPEFPDQTISPLSGPNVTAGETFYLRSSAENKTDKPLTVVPRMEIYIFDMVREYVDTIEYKPITIEPGEIVPMRLPVTATDRPEVYSAYIHLKTQDGQSQSTLADYRWIVRGKDADIMSTRISSLATKKGDFTYVRLDYVGPADAESVVTGKVIMELKDEAGVIGRVTVPETQLTDAIHTGIVRIHMKRDLVGQPTLVTQIVDEEDAVLDIYEVPFLLTAEQIQKVAGQNAWSNWFKWYRPLFNTIGIGVTVIVLFIAGFYVAKRLKA